MQPLSNEQHYDENAIHNTEYDHEAFLGAEEAKRFDQLSPEESKTRLGQIVDKIDKDKVVFFFFLNHSHLYLMKITNYSFYCENNNYSLIHIYPVCRQDILLPK